MSDINLGAWKIGVFTMTCWMENYKIELVLKYGAAFSFHFFIFFKAACVALNTILASYSFSRWFVVTVAIELKK